MTWYLAIGEKRAVNGADTVDGRAGPGAYIQAEQAMAVRMGDTAHESTEHQEDSGVRCELQSITVRLESVKCRVSGSSTEL